LDAEVKPNCFIVRDGNGQTLSYIYYESESVRRSAVKLLGKDEVRRIAARIASCRSAGAGAPGFNHKVRSCGSERLIGGQPCADRLKLRFALLGQLTRRSRKSA